MPFYTLRHSNISEFRVPWLFFGFLHEFQRISNFEIEEQSFSPWYYFYPQTSPFWADVFWFVHARHWWFSPLFISSLNLYPIFVTSRCNKNIWKFCPLGHILDVFGQEHCVDILISILMQDTRAFPNLLYGLGTHTLLSDLPLI